MDLMTTDDVDQEASSRSMERSTRWPRALMMAALVCCTSLWWLPIPVAQADEKLSEERTQELLVELRLQIEEAIPFDGAQLEPPTELTLRGELPSMWRVELIAPSSWRTTRLQAKVFDLEDASRPVAFLQVPVTIKLPVFKVLSTLKASALIDESEVEISYSSIFDVPHDAIFSVEDIQEKVTRRRVQAGKILCASMLDDPVVFERGDVVKILVRRGSVELLDTGVALERGKLNHAARVQSTSTDAVIKGVVSPQGVVY